MTSRTAFDLIVFDLDGTLVDSRLDLANAVNELITSHGGAELALEAITAMIGEGARTLVQRALAAAQLGVGIDAALRQFLVIYERRMLEHTVCYRGMDTVVEELCRRVPLAVLTNKPLRPTEQILAHFDLLRRFGAVVGGDGPLPRKPEPDGLLELIDRFGASPNRTLMVGDSLVDVRTAENAHVMCCVAAFGFGFPGHDALAHSKVFIAERPTDLLTLCVQGHS